MKLLRRKFLHLAVGAATVTAFPRFATALDYLNRPVRFVVEFVAGCLSDIIARTIAEVLSKQLGQQVIVDDQAGAGGNLATSLVVRGPPDGYTLLEATSSNVWNAILSEKLSFDFVHDITPVALISLTPGVMAVTPSFPAKTVPEFIAYAKTNPGQINMASGGIGSMSPGSFSSL
jgi:tripartite-type tricarboxylate transporter receptor subunit TctC